MTISLTIHAAGLDSLRLALACDGKHHSALGPQSTGVDGGPACKFPRLPTQKAPDRRRGRALLPATSAARTNPPDPCFHDRMLGPTGRQLRDAGPTGATSHACAVAQEEASGSRPATGLRWPRGAPRRDKRRLPLSRTSGTLKTRADRPRHFCLHRIAAHTMVGVDAGRDPHSCCDATPPPLAKRCGLRGKRARTREHSKGKLDAPSASQGTDSCEQESSSGAAGALVVGIGHDRSRRTRRRRHQPLTRPSPRARATP
jgi:hypothetical protein